LKKLAHSGFGGAPEILLESLDAAEAETAAVRDQLKAILAEALAK
jgi:type I restriction enzyme M protein